jgi:transposase
VAPSATTTGVSALAHGLRLFPHLPGGGHLGEHAPSSGHDAARAGEPGGQSHGRHHRHAEREDDGKRGPRGYDAAKKVKGRKRHIAVDSSGLLLGIRVHAADIQDADGAGDLLWRLKRLYPWLKAVFADSVYDRIAVLLACFLLGLTLIVVRRIAGTTGFVLLPRRWVVEVVFTQMTKADVLALRIGGQHVTDLDLGIGDDHPIDEQQDELSALLEAGRGQAMLHSGAESL